MFITVINIMHLVANLHKHSNLCIPCDKLYNDTVNGPSINGHQQSIKCKSLTAYH